MRRLLPACITLFWAVMMASLVVQHVLPERRLSRQALIAPEILSLQWNDINEWNWILREGERVGGMRLLVIQDPAAADLPPGRGDYLLFQNLQLRLPVLGFSTRIQASMALRLDPAFKVAQFAGTVEPGPLRIRSAGFIEDEVLYYRVETSGAPAAYGSLTLPSPLSLLSAVEPLITRHFDLRLGETYRQEVFAPGKSGAAEARVTVAARETIQIGGKPETAYRLETTLGTVTRRSWVNEKGVTLRSELFQGMVAEHGLKLEILRAFPELRTEEPMPALDARAFKTSATLAGRTGAPPALPLGALESFLGGL